MEKIKRKKKIRCQLCLLLRFYFVFVFVFLLVDKIVFILFINCVNWGYVNDPRVRHGLKIHVHYGGLIVFLSARIGCFNCCHFCIFFFIIL